MSTIATPKTIADILQRTRDAYADYTAAIAAFPDDDALTVPGTIGDWSVRDVIAHVGADQLWMAGQLEALRFEKLPTVESCYGIDTPVPEGIDLATQDGRNAWQRERLRGLSLADVRSMASEAHARLLSVISTFKDEQLGDKLTIAELKTIGWIREPREGEAAWPLEQWLGGVTYRHFADHAEALREAAKQKTAST